MAIVYESRSFKIDVSSVAFPSGRTHQVTVVRHAPSVVVLPVMAPGRIVLIRQFRASLGRMLWELPAGSLKPGETPEAAAVRECAEETGLVPGRVERIRGLFPAPGFCDEELIFFLAIDLSRPAAGEEATQDDDEEIEVHEMAVDEARAMAARGEIVDLKTAYGLTLL
jgi:ADP-ribose pyrophosphatase